MTPLERDLVAGERWAFDAAVAASFDEMLARSIPQYEVMRGLVDDLAASRTPATGTIVDLGTSRGEAIARLVERTPLSVTFVGVETSEPMRRAFAERFASDMATLLRSAGWESVECVWRWANFAAWLAVKEGAQ